MHKLPSLSRTGNTSVGKGEESEMSKHMTFSSREVLLTSRLLEVKILEVLELSVFKFIHVCRYDCSCLCVHICVQVQVCMSAYGSRKATMISSPEMLSAHLKYVLSLSWSSQVSLNWLTHEHQGPHFLPFLRTSHHAWHF